MHRPLLHYTEAEQGFNWSVFFVSSFFALIKQYTTRLFGIWLFVLELLSLFLYVYILDTATAIAIVFRDATPYLLAPPICILIFTVYRILLAFFFNTLHAPFKKKG